LIRLFASIRLRRRSREQRGRHSQSVALDYVVRGAVQLTMSSIRPRRGEVEERCGEKFFNNSLKINNQKITFLKQVDYVEFPKNHFLFIHHIQKRTRELFYKKKK
jgi:hypothetical protein